MSDDDFTDNPLQLLDIDSPYYDLEHLHANLNKKQPSWELI